MAINHSDPLALTVDDDPDFNALLEKALMPLGIKVVSATTPGEFLQHLKVIRPNLCLVDLNIGEAQNGFSLIESTRAILGPSVPVLVLSSVSAQQQIAYAVELGANDFIIKPISRALLATKLGKYLSLETLKIARRPLTPVPQSKSGVFIEAKLSITGVDELGLTVTSEHLIAKGTEIWLSGSAIPEIAGGESRLRVRAVSSLAKTDSTYTTRLEFDPDRFELLSSVRNWLLRKSSGGADLKP